MSHHNQQLLAAQMLGLQQQQMMGQPMGNMNNWSAQPQQQQWGMGMGGMQNMQGMAGLMGSPYGQMANPAGMAGLGMGMGGLGGLGGLRGNNTHATGNTAHDPTKEGPPGCVCLFVRAYVCISLCFIYVLVYIYVPVLPAECIYTPYRMYMCMCVLPKQSYSL